MQTTVATAQKVKTSTKITIVIGMFMAFFVGSSLMINAAVVTSPDQINKITAQPDTQKPFVSLTTNLSGATVYGTVDILAVLFDNEEVDKIELYLDGQLKFIESCPEGNWLFPLNTASIANGTHALLLKVYDTAGNSSIINPVIFTVKN